MYIDHKIGDLVVEQRHNDGYINTTKLTKAYEQKTGTRKNATKWFENDRTNQYIELLSDKTGLEVYDLVQKKGSGRNQETWIHPKLAISFAMWLSPEFEMIVAVGGRKMANNWSNSRLRDCSIASLPTGLVSAINFV